MKTNYFDLSPLARGVAHFVFKKGETTYESIKERFDEQRARIGIDEIMSQKPSLLLFSAENGTYKASKTLEFTLKALRHFA